ncbi:prolyl-tRNA editing enzyme YbaK/EbsC (Cys-tRNA(Pro) deacylase) [Actinoalloteichus hoggarensis]|uniref:Cys-tRNA(Pro)/Cys-tRNA(Cys) deacylase YbaK n=1 Tax=Actinoalloteichus hoggarensis TaxID=1470176 RepID=A0A221W8W6_9PSEU|nr:YbaK/EbsC family protein [Actinoalloteichus hoggarensis]ASO22143.1 Cys-tRNA(Pro)/Cys-tRNA(Cys) deacylase YbaK [Actinoalloteichus hoggarensis]MBB5923775.1 prolyl-tRNA editing enzyme YbaK/EbsC (Cys-tRNA(Pro) deacylase) [Actinoalloteichus hoggarensis]
MSSIEHPGVRKVVAALAEAGLPAAAEAVRVLEADVRTAAQAAEAVGVDVGAIANSLVFDAGSTPLLALTSGAHRADTALLASAIGVAAVGRATPDFVRTHTGQPIGGVSPVGHPAPITTLIDASLAEHPVIWAAAGHPKALFPITFAELVTLTGGRVLDVAEAGGARR